MTTTWSNILSAIIAVAIFWFGFNVGSSTTNTNNEKVVDKLRSHNDGLEVLLATKEGKSELLRFVVSEAALAGTIIEIGEEIEKTNDIDRRSLAKKFVDSSKEVIQRAKSGFKGGKEKLTNKLLNKANSIISNAIPSDRKDDNEEDEES